MKKNVLGVKIDDINMNQVLKIVESWLSKKDKHYIVTPNPEIVMLAQDDEDLKRILNNADLAIPDGAGLKLGRLLNRRTGDIVCNTPGIDLMEALIKLASEKGFTIGLLGGRDQVADEAAERLKSRYPKLKVVFASGDIEVDEDGMGRLPRSASGGPRNDEVVDFLFVAFGPPKQEKWIDKNLKKLNVKVAMVVGGSFDVISGKVPRAPLIIRRIGFEWLFRLIVQPWRIKRQVALIKYLLLLLSK